MSFYIRVDDPVDTTSLPTTCGENGACYYGQCGLTGKCECADGYSGANCGTGEILMDVEILMLKFSIDTNFNSL